MLLMDSSEKRGYGVRSLQLFQIHIKFDHGEKTDVQIDFTGISPPRQHQQAELMP